jgi:osmoprotectant transport system substrate-binding protein
MIPFIHSFKAKSLAFSFSLLLIVALSACGNSATTGSSGSASKGTIVVGSKLDVEGQLLGEMYVLLLQKAGYTVTSKLALGNSIITEQAIKSGAIDIYPDYTATGLNELNIPSSYNPQTDYTTVKTQYEKQFHITWLNPAPLNDGYAICTSKSEAQHLGITSISQLVPLVPQLNLTSPSDGISFINGLKKVYGFTTQSFKSTKQVDYSVGFQAVIHGQAQVTVCYTTDGTVQQQNFIFLTDDKNGFPQFNPAPLVRDAILTKYPNVATILNPLAPDLTTQISIQLQQQVAAAEKNGTSSSEAVKSVAQQFLQSKGLL